MEGPSRASQDSEQIWLTHTPGPMRKRQTSWPPAFFLVYFCFQSFLCGRLSLLPIPAGRLLLASWLLGSSTSQLSDSSRLHGAQPEGLKEVTVIAKNGMLAGGLPQRAGRKLEKAAAFLLPPPWGANYRPAAHCTGECLGPAAQHTRTGHLASPGKGG